MKLEKGNKALEFSLSDQNGNETKLIDYKGKKVLIYFYPKADTPGCTTQTCSVNDSLKQLEKLNIVAFGISPDPVDKQKKFSDKFSVKFPLLCDTDNSVAVAYNVWGEKNMYGKKYMGIIRSSFLIDENGIIKEAWYNVSPGDTVTFAIKALEN